MKPKTSTTENEPYKFKELRSYSVEEIFAAGGPTAFGRMRGQNNKTLIEALKNSPIPEPFTDEEWDDLMAELKRDK